ncbi:hypothetical protein FRC10_001748 [Ceratobasidium sp. 414]|nr:hypothetical protein FRC10_001748 [Ceratobasidium sp. 414]
MQSRFVPCTTRNRAWLKFRTISPIVSTRVFGSGAYALFTLCEPLANNGSTTVSGSKTLSPQEFPREAQSSRSNYYQIPQKLGSRDSDAGPLREVHVAIRVKELCKTGQLDEAIHYCNNIPTALQGPIAWNTVIQTALEAKRYNFAYTQFLAMKKRAVRPTMTTFHIFLTAYARAAPEILTSLHLERAEKLHNDWAHLISSGQNTETKDAPRAHPAAAYIDVVANAGAYQKIWDVFYELESQGPLAPNEHVFTSMLIAFTKRAGGADLDKQSVRARNAQDAKLVWRHVLRATERQPFPIDSHLVTAVLRALRHGGESEHELAFGIIGEYLGLPLPGVSAPVEPSGPKVELNPRALDAALAVCYSAGRPDLTKHYIDTLIYSKSPPRGNAVTTSAMDHLLSLYATSGSALQAQETIEWMLQESALSHGLDVRPGSGSWALAFRACAKAKDWNTAKSLLDRITRPVVQPGGKKEWFVLPDAETTYFILKTAHISRPADRREGERQLWEALKVVEFVSKFWTRGTRRLDQLVEAHPTRALRRLAFQNQLVTLVNEVLSEFKHLGDHDRWAALRGHIEGIRVNLSEEVTKRYSDCA